MDTPEWYAISVGALVALSIISCIILFFASLLRIYGKFYVLKYVFYPQLPRFLPGRQDATGFDLLILVAFLGGNILSMKLNVRTKADFISRSAMVCTINLIPLALGARMNIIASRCGIKLSTYSRAHRWLGRVAIIEGLIHVAVAMSSQKPDLRKLHDIAGLVVSALPLRRNVSLTGVRVQSPCFLLCVLVCSGDTSTSFILICT
jgi:hypothetical protein